MANEQFISPLAEKLIRFRPESEHASFDVFLNRVQEKKRKKIGYYALFIALGLFGIITWSTFYSAPSPSMVTNQSVPAPAPSPTESYTSAPAPLPPKKQSILHPSPEVNHVATVAPRTPKTSGQENNVTQLVPQSSVRSLPLLYGLVPTHNVQLTREFDELNDVHPLVLGDRESVLKMLISKPVRMPFLVFNSGASRAHTQLNMMAGSGRYIHPEFEEIYYGTQVSEVSAVFTTSVNIPIAKHFWFGGGLGFTGNRLSGLYRYILDSVPVYDLDNTIGGYLVYPDGSPLRNVDLGSAERSYSFIQVPVSLTYVAESKNYELHVGVGADFSYLIEAKGNSLDAFNLKEVLPLNTIINPQYASFQTNVTGFRKVNSLTSIGLGIGYGQQLNKLYDASHYRIANRAFQINLVTKFNLPR
ncbi:MAG: hypothetical protein JJ975_08640 [Bacteroidia bacterium]|nr:hypothetical protein [Bacteroidia bacterium]